MHPIRYSFVSTRYFLSSVIVTRLIFTIFIDFGRIMIWGAVTILPCHILCSFRRRASAENTSRLTIWGPRSWRPYLPPRGLAITVRHVHDAVARSDDQTPDPSPDRRPEARARIDARRPADEGAATRLKQRAARRAECAPLDAPLDPSAGDRHGHDGVVKRVGPVRVHPVDRIVPGVAVEVDAAAVPQRVARQEPPLLRVVVAVGAQDQAGLHVRVVPRLPPEAKHVRRPRTLLAEAVVEVGGEHRPVAARPLGHAAALVEGIPERAGGGQAVGLGVARDQPLRPEHGLGDQAGAGVEFADGDAPVVEGVGARPGVYEKSTREERNSSKLCATK